MNLIVFNKQHTDKQILVVLYWQVEVEIQITLC